VKVVYGEAMVAPLLGHISPSSFKPKLLVAHLQTRNYPLELVDPPALTRSQLALAHAPEHVDAILDCQEPNGFGNLDPQIAATLPFTSGSLYRAAELALEERRAVASFSSGFHHAHYDHCGGFCTFNGLMVVAQLLRNRIRKLMILDLDYHYGDGTDHIIHRVGADFVVHETFGRVYRHRDMARDYLLALDRVLHRLDGSDIDLVLYQAGADVHVDDPLGGVLSTEQMAERDRMVFTATRRADIPVAWNLAGGYQRDAEGTILPVLSLHEQTYRIAQQIYSDQEESVAS
jgi:acetoin utilization deacetylase AcuC-like enzyme